MFAFGENLKNGEDVISAGRVGKKCQKVKQVHPFIRYMRAMGLLLIDVL